MGGDLLCWLEGLYLQMPGDLICWLEGGCIVEPGNQVPMVLLSANGLLFGSVFLICTEPKY